MKKLIINESQIKKLTESLIDDISRLNPERQKNDDKAYKLFGDIVKDFNEYGQNFKKLTIHDDGGTKINLHELSIGKTYRITYIFGKYHPIYRDPHTGNAEIGKRIVNINKVPFIFTLRRNELERAFNTAPIKFGNVTVNDIEVVYNPEAPVPNAQKERVDKYKISGDLANKLFKYFIEIWNEKYPDHKNLKYKGNHPVKDIEKGVPPTVKWITVRSKDGEWINYELRQGENERKVKERLRKMTKDEADKEFKLKQKELYKDSSERFNKQREEIEKKVTDFLKSEFPNILEHNYLYNNHIKIRSFYPGIEFYVEFRYPEDITDKIKETLSNVKINNYEGELKRVNKGYGDSSYLYYLVQFTNSDGNF